MRVIPSYGLCSIAQPESPSPARAAQYAVAISFPVVYLASAALASLQPAR